MPITKSLQKTRKKRGLLNSALAVYMKKNVIDIIRGFSEIGTSLSKEREWHVSWPLSSLSISPKSIILKAWAVKYTFERATIKCLFKMNTSSLLIIHTNSSYCKIVIFTPLTFSALEKVLHKNGYHVTIEKPSFSEIEAINYSNDSLKWYRNPIVILIHVTILISILFWIWREMSG